MNNKTIVLGTVNFDWHFAKGHYMCHCANTEDTNAFDRVICGILYRSNGYMAKTELAKILGFNVVNNPTKNCYVDQSEKAIFDKAVLSLVEYGLVVDDSLALTLTHAGRHSFETRTKQRVEKKEVFLWGSEYSNAVFDEEILTGLSMIPVECPIQQDWNVLRENPIEVLKLQKGELVDVEAGKSVTSMQCVSMDYYVANLVCKICYNVENQRIYACSSMGSIAIDNILSNNEILQDRLLDEFFKDKKVSVIYKPSYQKEKEQFILEQGTEEISQSNVITCKEEFLSKLNENVVKDNASIVFLSIRNITEFVKNCLNQLEGTIACVDYVEGELEGVPDDIQLNEHNINYRKIEELRTSDLCVNGNTYYSTLPYIITHKNIEYDIPLVYTFNEENKYNHTALFAPFADNIIDKTKKIVSDTITALMRNPLPKYVNTIMKYCTFIGKLDFVNDEIGKPNMAEWFQGTSDAIREAWLNILHGKLNELEEEINTGGDKSHAKHLLEQIELDERGCVVHDDDVLSHIYEVRKKIDGVGKITMPVELTPTTYILDTSVFMDMPKILDRFDLKHDKVIVPRAMEQELDGLKHNTDRNIKANATMATLFLRRKMADNPNLTIKDNVDKKLLPKGFDHKKNDNDMLAAAIEVETEDNNNIVIVSNDIGFISNINDCKNSQIISDRIEGINLDELLIRLQGNEL